MDLENRDGGFVVGSGWVCLLFCGVVIGSLCKIELLKRDCSMLCWFGVNIRLVCYSGIRVCLWIDYRIGGWCVWSVCCVLWKSGGWECVIGCGWWFCWIGNWWFWNIVFC